MNETQRAYLELHLAVLLFGVTAILGDLIQLSALVIVWWRVLITSFSLLFLIRVFRLFREMPWQLILQYVGIGILVALHWLAFYGAIKVANASISLICMATTSFFTALLEPLILKQRIKGYELFLGLLIVPGMALIVNNIDLSLIDGIYIGLASAFLASLFATLNKKLVTRANPLSITFLELGSAWLFLSIVLPFYFWKIPEAQLWPDWSDWIYLLLLALLCTTLAYVLALRALKHISAFASNLTINLEPVYGIILAWLVLDDHEELPMAFYYGVAIILLAVFSYPFIRRYQRKRGK